MKLRRGIVVFSVSMLLLAANQAQARKLKDLLPNLFGPSGITLERVEGLGCCPGVGHEPHFVVESQAELTTLNNALRGQLGNFPLASPASGFTYQFDPNLGTFTRSTESFGPIFADRAETVGRGKWSLGFSYSRFTYDTLDGNNLDNGELQLTLLHDPTDPTNGRQPPFAFEVDTITVQIFADITTDLFVLSGTYGILDNLDVSIAIPIVWISMNVTGVATNNNESKQTVGTPPRPAHTFPGGSTTLTASASDESTGIGDILLQAKYNFYRRKPFALAVGLGLRLPTGDEDELRGIGTVRVRPSFIASANLSGFAPHVNVGFDLGDTSKLEDEFFYRAGFDLPIVKPVTFAFDLLGRYVIDNNRPQAGRAPGSGETAGDNILDIALGFKINPWRNALLLLNVLFALNDTGLRDTITPLFGVEVSF